MHMHLIEPHMFRSDMSRSSFKVNFNMNHVPVEADPSRSMLSQKNPSIIAIWHLVLFLFHAFLLRSLFTFFTIFYTGWVHFMMKIEVLNVGIFCICINRYTFYACCPEISRLYEGYSESFGTSAVTLLFIIIFQ